MHRFVSLMVVLAHLGVASVPCFETEFAATPLSTAPVSATHHVPAAPVRAEPDDRADPHAEHAHHQSVDERARQQHGVAPDSVHISTAASVPTEDIATEARVVLHELHALCMCGCSSNSETPGTTTSPRLGLALLPADSPSLAETEPSVGVRASIPLPAPVADAFDHVPIFS